MRTDDQHVEEVKERHRLDLCVGEFAEVRREQEILAMLDEWGRLDGLPFMPELPQSTSRRLMEGTCFVGRGVQ
jgi:hypothetical protein